MNNKTEKINNISNDKTLDTLLKFRREFISLMLEYENKLTEEENRALEQAYRGYIKFFSKWLKRNGYIDNDEE